MRGSYERLGTYRHTGTGNQWLCFIWERSRAEAPLVIAQVAMAGTCVPAMQQIWAMRVLGSTHVAALHALTATANCREHCREMMNQRQGAHGHKAVRWKKRVALSNLLLYRHVLPHHEVGKERQEVQRPCLSLLMAPSSHACHSPRSVKIREGTWR